MKKALRVLVDGTVEDLDLDAPEGALSVLQNGVKFDDADTYPLVQPVDIAEDLTMWVHEEGKMLGHPYNSAGSIVFDGAFGQNIDRIFGNIVFTGGTDEEGDTLGLPEKYDAGLRGLAFTIWDIRNKV